MYNIYDRYYGLVNLAYSNSKGELSFLPTSKSKSIYLYEFGEGEDFYIFNYNSDEIKKVIKKNNFKKIKVDNENEVKQLLTKYREDLCEKELKLFDKITSISELSTIGNYYLYLELKEKKVMIFYLVLFLFDYKLEKYGNYCGRRFVQTNNIFIFTRNKYTYNKLINSKSVVVLTIWKNMVIIIIQMKKVAKLLH